VRLFPGDELFFLKGAPATAGLARPSFGPHRVVPSFRHRADDRDGRGCKNVDMSSTTISIPVRPESRVEKFPDEIPGYVVRPSGEVRGGLIVIHEVWGLVPHIRQVAERYAAEGYLVVAPDILSAVGIESQIGYELHREYS